MCGLNTSKGQSSGLTYRAEGKESWFLVSTLCPDLQFGLQHIVEKAVLS